LILLDVSKVNLVWQSFALERHARENGHSGTSEKKLDSGVRGNDAQIHATSIN
jgi:hypothetical protein